MISNTKREVWIFVLVNYGLMFLMGIVMWIGSKRGVDLSNLVNVQMLYPATGVIVAYLATRFADGYLPKRFFITFISITGALLLCTLGSMFTILPDIGGVPLSTLIPQLILMAGSILFWIMLLTEQKVKRIAYGLTFVNGKKSVLMIALFIVLYMISIVIAYVMQGQLPFFGQLLVNPVTWYITVNALLNFFLSIVAFFGEEYGWRYFLQPIMQKRFGKRMGVLFLGVVWGLWHLPVNLFFNAAEGSGFTRVLIQLVVCITVGTFMAYAYMKTNNIWVPVIIHFLNNNLAVIFSGEYTTAVQQNQMITWESILITLAINGVLFLPFLFAKEFRKEKTEVE